MAQNQAYGMDGPGGQDVNERHKFVLHLTTLDDIVVVCADESGDALDRAGLSPHQVATVIRIHDSSPVHDMHPGDFCMPTYGRRGTRAYSEIRHAVNRAVAAGYPCEVIA